jgi:hypothetical protein
VIFPCGKIANSIFSDEITVKKDEVNVTFKPPRSKTVGIIPLIRYKNPPLNYKDPKFTEMFSKPKSNYNWTISHIHFCLIFLVD